MKNLIKKYIKLLIEGRISESKVDFLVKKYLPKFIEIYKKFGYNFISKELNSVYNYDDAGDNPEYILSQFIKFISEKIDASLASDYTEWLLKNSLKYDNFILAINDLLEIRPILSVHNLVKKFNKNKKIINFNQDINFYNNFDSFIKDNNIKLFKYLRDSVTDNRMFLDMLGMLPVIRTEYIKILINTIKEDEAFIRRFHEDKERYARYFSMFEEKTEHIGHEIEGWTMYDLYIHLFPMEEEKDYDLDDIKQLIKNIKENLKEHVDYKILIDGEMEFLINILTPKASCLVGRESEWCISTTTQSGEPTSSASRYFYDYSNNSRVFFYIKDYFKYMFTLPENENGIEDTQFMDEDDHSVVIPFSKNAIENLYNFYLSERNNLYDIIQEILDYSEDVGFDDTEPFFDPSSSEYKNIINIKYYIEA
jgi:hypothetical protein